MKKGALLYTPDDAKKNRWFIDSFIKAGRDRDCGIILCLSPSEIPEDIDFAVNRSRSSLMTDILEERGIDVFNNSFVTEVTGDKWDTYCCLKSRVPMTDTVPASKTCPLDFPCIVKPRHGHGGQDIFLINNEKEYSRALDIICSIEYTDFTGKVFFEEAIVQPVLDTGRDLRVYVLGNRILAAVLRTSDKDFRSNYSLGGHAEIVEPDKEILDMSEKLCILFDFDFAGIDFIFDGARPVLNEIEDAVGSRMLYSLMPDIDIPGMYIDHILSKIG